ncbi:MAG: hypothetical protein MJE77_13975 [Proteobacteria bacterium]|nr:hypothetical protein [Pseudomonadota bacterium]
MGVLRHGDERLYGNGVLEPTASEYFLADVETSFCSAMNTNPASQSA